jgi:predicted dehydrogenase
MTRIRVAVVGCGMIAQIAHLPHLARLHDLFEVVAVCDQHADVAQAVATRFQVPKVFTDVEDMLTRTPELAAVVVLTLDHLGPILAAVARGKHVLTEKPLGYTIGELEELAAAADRTGSKVMVGYMKRYDAGVRRGLEEIARIQRPVLARIHLVVGPDYGNWIIPQLARIIRTDQPGPAVPDTRRIRVAREWGSNPIPPEIAEVYMDMFGVWSHDINLYRAAFPAPPASIAAHCSPDGRTFTATLQYDDGFQCVFSGSTTSVRRFDESLTVWGEDRTVTLDISNPFLQNTPSTVRILRNGSANGCADDVVEEIVTGSHEEAFQLQLSHFYACVTSEQTQPLTGIRESILDTRLMIGLVRSAASGVKPKSWPTPDRKF